MKTLQRISGLFWTLISILLFSTSILSQGVKDGSNQWSTIQQTPTSRDRDAPVGWDREAHPGNENYNVNKKEFHGPSTPCVDPEGKKGECRLPIQCAVYFPQFIRTNNLKHFKCNLPNGLEGFCCPELKKANGAVRSVLQPEEFFHVNLPPQLSQKIQKELNQTADTNLDVEQSHSRQDEDFVRKGAFCQKGTASYGHLLFFMTSESAEEKSRLARSLLECSLNLKRKYKLNAEDGGMGLQEFSMGHTRYSKECPRKPECRRTLYRTPDGSCNNLAIPEMGMSMTPLVRLIPPAYEDGLWSPRVSHYRHQLPSARQLSASIIRDEQHPHSFYTLWVMQFGQFIDHDQTHVPVFRLANGRGIECCTDRGRGFMPQETTHPMCNAIQIPVNDEFHSRFGSRCMNFVRSMIAPRRDCTLGYADQMNQVTHWLDSSNIYGSTAEDERELRRNQTDGLLNFDSLNGRRRNQYPNEILPRSSSSRDECTDPRTGRFCFLAGDLRSNEMIGLTATHTLWMREHNRIARQLKRINPTFTGDRIYNEAKRIVNAEYQHIIYNEWLPIVIGKQYMDNYGITPISYGYSTDYDDSINGGISNAFSAAAMRMGHTLIQGIIELVRAIGYEKSGEVIIIHNHFNEAFDIVEDGRLDRILKSLTQMTVQSYDSFITSEVTNRLFQPRNESYGMDLIALNIQRARDHGLPGYNYYREICSVGRGKVSTFDEFKEEIPSHIVELMKLHYKHVDDVDLYIGGITETPFPGSLMGPTFLCIIADQFVRLKKGDRFAYDIGSQPHSFNIGQLEEIRKSSFARILCDNGNLIDTVQPLAFYRPHSIINPMTSCEDPKIPKINLGLWRNEDEDSRSPRRG